MPYIGNQHNVGDHVNNFKVLDDISSYTATFDGSATSIISTADNTIRIPEHRFIQGQRVTYTNGGGGNIGGLTTGTAYFVSFDSANTIKLATTLANANSNTVINLSAVGSGTSHTLNAAFDGVNTKFKMTHGSGKSARLNNATQLNVAINNVIQRPNLDPNNFTDGFALQDNHKIVFKTAPTVNDVFWGSIIANTIENFDLRDNEVDNFTGDGSTSEFTLSTIPANNESVIVSINGVVQHPSDKNTARAYTLIDSIIQFTAAPALGDGIQVRHIGFAGASTNDVSGFYGRTGNVALTSSDHITTGDITSRNINSSGIITATTFSGGFSGNVVGTSATFTGNLSVGGVLTYEDVTNVDSVGIITAQKDIHVGAGVSVVGIITASTIKSTNLSSGRVVFTTSGGQLEGSGNLTYNGTTLASGSPVDINSDLDVDGHTNLDNVSIAGIATFASDVAIGRSMYHVNDIDTSIGFPQNGRVRISGDNETVAEFAGSYGGGGSIGLYKQVNATGGTVNISPTIASSTSPVLTVRNNSQSYDTVLNFQNTNARSSVIQWNNYNNTSTAGNLIFRSFNSPNTEYARFTGAGNFNLLKDLDVDGHTELDNVRITGIVTATSLTVAGNQILGHGNSTGNQIKFTRSGLGDELVIGTDGYGNSTQYEATIQSSIVTARPLVFATNNTERLRIHSTGKITIGNESSPGGLLHIKEGDSGLSAANTNADTVFIENGANAGITIATPNTNTGYLTFADPEDDNVGQIIYRHGGSYANSMGFFTNAGERIRIMNNGNVNIGTSELDQTVTGRLLNVYGGQIRARQTSSGNTLEAFGHTTSGQSYGLLVNAGTTANDYAATFRNSGGTTMFRVRGDGSIRVGDNSSFSAHANASNLVVGTTSGSNGMTLLTGSGTGTIFFNDGSGNDGVVQYVHSSSPNYMRIASSGHIRFDAGAISISDDNIAPTAGDLASGASFGIPKLHIRGDNSQSGAYELLGRFQSGTDADSSGATIVLNHSNDRGIAIQGGRSVGNRSHGAIMSIDNVGRLSNAIKIYGGNGSGVNYIALYTGESTSTSSRLHIDSTGRISVGKHGVGTYNDGNEYFKIQSNDTAAVLSIIGSNDTHSTLALGDEDDFNRTRLRADHTNDKLQFYVADTERLILQNGGVLSQRVGSYARLSHGILEITTSSTPSQIKITTNLPYSGSSGSHAESVTIRGFRYGGRDTVDLQICWHVYAGQFYNRIASSSGAWAPQITLGVENNKVVIHMNSLGYWPKIYVSDYYSSYNDESYAKGWSWSDSAISGDSGTPVNTVPYKNDWGGLTYNDDHAIGSGHLKIHDGDLQIGTSGHGIDFSATSNGSGASGINETLDDYEFGDFTPTLYSNSNRASTAGEDSSHTGAGQYVKVGKLVTVTVDFNNLHNNAVNHVLRYITGLPFTSRSNNRTTAAIGYQRGLHFVYASSTETTNMHHLYGHIGGSETRITLNASKGSSPYSGWPATHNTGTSQSQYMRITMSYFTD